MFFLQCHATVLVNEMTEDLQIISKPHFILIQHFCSTFTNISPLTRSILQIHLLDSHVRHKTKPWRVLMRLLPLWRIPKSRNYITFIKTILCSHHQELILSGQGEWWRIEHMLSHAESLGSPWSFKELSKYFPRKKKQTQKTENKYKHLFPPPSKQNQNQN